MSRMSRTSKKRLISTLSVISFLIVCLVVLRLTSSHPKPATLNQYTKGEPSTGNTSGQGNGSSTTPEPSTQPGDTKDAAGSTYSSILIKPTGTFVSNHHPNLSGSPTPNTLSSVCTTTPGASCTITFTKDGVTKSLPAQTTDRGGSTYWNNWSLQSIGLTTGSWKVEAIAKNANQTVSTTDPLYLEVEQ